MTQNWSTLSKEDLSKLSDQRLNEVLKRARKQFKRDEHLHSIDKCGGVELSNSNDYYNLVKDECATRPHFDKGDSK